MLGQHDCYTTQVAASARGAGHATFSHTTHWGPCSIAVNTSPVDSCCCLKTCLAGRPSVATFTLRCCAENGEAGSQGVAAAAHSLQDSLDHSTDAANSNQETSERRARVKDLFYAMDKDGNGKLDVGEFRGKTYCEQLLCPLTLCHDSIMSQVCIAICCRHSHQCCCITILTSSPDCASTN